MSVSTNLNKLKGAFGIVGGTGFMIVGALFAITARKYQLSGEPMPNGKGGFMSFRDGYYVSFVLVAMAAAWIYFGYRALRKAVSSEESELYSNKN